MKKIYMYNSTLFIIRILSGIFNHMKKPQASYDDVVMVYRENEKERQMRYLSSIAIILLLIILSLLAGTFVLHPTLNRIAWLLYACLLLSTLVFQTWYARRPLERRDKRIQVVVFYAGFMIIIVFLLINLIYS